MLLRTHGFQAYQAAQYNVMDRQRDVFPFWQYLTMGDDHVRDSHKALNGVVLPANHDFWKDHYPPWDYGCRCQVVPLSEDDVADVRAADAGRPPEAREMIEGAQLEKLEQNGTLFRALDGASAQNFDVRSPLAKAATADDKQRAFRWHPGDLRLDVDQLKARYDAPVWASFEKFARGQDIGDGRTAWEWLNGKPAGPLSFGTTDAALAWGDAHMKPALATLSKPETGALRSYQDPGDFDINNLLRHPTKRGLPQAAQTQVELLDAAIAKSTTPRPLTVYRGVTDAGFMRGLKAGDVFEDSGYFSTSLSREYAGARAREAFVTVRLPAGAKAIYMDKLTAEFEREAELLLARNGKFSVLAVKNVQGVLHIELEMAGL